MNKDIDTVRTLKTSKCMCTRVCVARAVWVYVSNQCITIVSNCMVDRDVSEWQKKKEINMFENPVCVLLKCST